VNVSSRPTLPLRAPFRFSGSSTLGLLLAATLLGISACGPSEDPVDLVLLNGTVVTVDDERPEAEGVAISGHRIVAVGTSREMRRFIGPDTEVIDLEGRLAIPGLIEAHGHFLSLGRAKMILDLTQAETWEEIVEMVAAAAREAEPGEWITGRGWHQEKWDPAPTPNVDGVPLHAELSRVTPDNPVNLTHASGHASFANARAMSEAGITRRTANPAGGEIVKDAQGEPTGLLRETAQRLVGQAIERSRRDMTDEDRHAEFMRQVELAGEEALSKGVTSFHDAGASFAEIDRFRELEARGELPIRLYVMVRRESNETMARLLPEYRMVAEGNDFLTVRSIKRQIDGALGPHGASVLEPYLDLPSSTGLVLETPEDIRGTAEVAIRHGFQVNTHAIGDRANREVLDIYEDVFEQSGNPPDLRWRIEHAQHLHPSDVQRFADLGVIASMQGIHGTSDGPWVLARLGPERAQSGAYLWRSLIDAGVIIANGTDAPVEDIDPIDSFYASVSRVMVDGERFYPDQRMTREEALRSYTINNAYAAFEEELKGSITPGKLADITVLSRNIMTIPEEEIPGTRVDFTILGGEVRFRR
jgi:predicted amidohydrolase YtcJ